VHLKADRSQLSLAHSAKVETDMSEKKETASMWSQSGGWKGKRMEQRIYVKKMSLNLEWKRERVMDADGGDKGNDKPTCVRSDESDKSS